MPERKIYRVIFRNHDRIFEIFVSSVSQGELLGFVEVEELLFGERSQVVVDPSEESIKNEFKGVQRVLIPMHAVIRIDQVEKQGVSRVAKASADGNVMPFPSPLGTDKTGPGSKKT